MSELEFVIYIAVLFGLVGFTFYLQNRITNLREYNRRLRREISYLRMRA